MDFYDDENAQLAFIEAMAASYGRAAASHEERVGLVLAGVPIELRFASPVLRDSLLPALLHLPRAAPDSVPELVISVWDRAGTGVAAPAPVFDKKRITDRGDIWGFVSKRFRLAFHYGEFSVNCFDRDLGRGYFWVDDAAKLPYWSRAAPLRTQLQWGMELKGRQLLHAAAVGTREGGVLLTGRGGIGKSSTALAALRHGMEFAGDDFVVVGLEPEPQVYPLYSSAKVNRDQITQFADLAAWSRNLDSDDEKIVFDLLPGFAARIPASMPIRAILVPEIAGQTDSAVSADIGLDAVRHAAGFSTIELLPSAGKYTYQFIDQLTRRVPARRLRLGSDRAGVAEALKNLLANPVPMADASAADSADAAAYPLVSVVVPAYNREGMIREVIANIRRQDYPELDIIVVDDGSTDATATVARGLPGIRVFEQPNGGPAQARNRGIINARGEYIAFLDSDDLWPDGMLRYLVDALRQDPDAQVARGWPQLARLGTDNEFEFEGNPLEGFPNYITGSVFRREALSRVGLFDPELRFGEDNDWFNRARECRVAVKRLDCVSVIIRRHGGNMTYGKNLVQLNVLRVAKKLLDRRRAAAPATGPAHQTPAE